MISDSDDLRPNFDKAQNEATKLLLQQPINSLYIDVRKFNFDRKINIDSVQHYAEIVNQPVKDFACKEFNGCCLLRYGDYHIILYNEREKNEDRKHWGITHELGHIYLDHYEDGPIQEVEAHFFAAQLLMPEIVLIEIAKKKGHISSRDIYSSFNVSEESAIKRINTLNRKGYWNCAEIDKMLLDRFKPLIYKDYKAPLKCSGNVLLNAQDDAVNI